MVAFTLGPVWVVAILSTQMHTVAKLDMHTITRPTWGEPKDRATVLMIETLSQPSGIILSCPVGNACLLDVAGIKFCWDTAFASQHCSGNGSERPA